jgi:hypothetical protein
MAQRIIKSIRHLLDLYDVDPTNLADERILKYAEVLNRFVLTEDLYGGDSDGGSGSGSVISAIFAPTVNIDLSTVTLQDLLLSDSLFSGTLTSSHFILLLNQYNKVENGLYSLDISNQLVRSLSFSDGDSFDSGIIVVVKEGTYANSFFTLSSSTSLLIGVDDIEWVMYGFNLDDLFDVVAPAMSGDRYLKYNSVTNTWESLLIDFVTSVNQLTNDITLTTNEIPETFSRRYFNRTRFLQEASLINLDVFADIEYDQTIYDSNVLTWDSVKNKWVPRSVTLNLDLDDLLDVVINYQDASPFYVGTVNTPIIKSVWNEQIQQYTSVASNLIDYNRHWLLAWVDNDTHWKVYRLEELVGRLFLNDLQDVSGAAPFAAEHGQALMWDKDLDCWRPGGYVELETSDDLLEGHTNLYLNTQNLPGIAKLSTDLGDLKQVDSLLSDMTDVNFPAAGVLGWNPANNKWGFVEMPTNQLTTANVPESPGYTGQDPPYSITNPSLRVYFSVERVRRALGGTYNGELEWIGNVNHFYGKVDGNVLCWNALQNRWMASNVAVGIFSTDHLPQGLREDREYYSDGRVADWAESIIQPSLNYHTDVNYINPSTGQSLIWDSDKEAWVSGYPLPLPITSLGDLLVGIGDNDFDYDKLSIGADKQFLRVNFSKPNLIEWASDDQNFEVSTVYPDIPHHLFIRSKDASDSII